MNYQVIIILFAVLFTTFVALFLPPYLQERKTKKREKFLREAEYSRRLAEIERELNL